MSEEKPAEPDWKAKYLELATAVDDLGFQLQAFAKARKQEVK